MAEIKCLLGNLELAGIKNFSVMISQLINVNSPAIVCEIDRCFRGNVFLFKNHLSEKIKDLHIVSFVGSCLKIKSDE